MAIKKISTTQFMNRYLRRAAPIDEPMRLTKYDKPYCDIYPIDDKRETVSEVESPFRGTHQGQCARCGQFAPLAMAQYNTEKGLVARLICRDCWDEVTKNKTLRSDDMVVMNTKKVGVFS